MSPSPTDWNAVAAAKLTRVLGERAGRAALDDALSALGIPALRSADDMRRCAEHLQERGGFAGAVGGLLSVHAAMYECTAVVDPLSDR
jgi:hypothetical protein